MILIYQAVQKILESTEDNFLMQVINDSTRRDALLDLLLVDKKEMVENVKVKDNLGYRKHEAVEFIIHREESKEKSRITTLDFKRANVGLLRTCFKDPIGNCLGEQKGWIFFNKKLFRA